MLTKNLRRKILLRKFPAISNLGILFSQLDDTILRCFAYSMKLIISCMLLFSLCFSASSANSWFYFKHYPWVYDNSTKDWLYLQGHTDGKMYSFNARTKQWGEFPDQNSSGETQPNAIESLINGPLLDNEGKEVGMEVLTGKTLGFYFGAQWCPYCKQFTPDLVNFRNDNKEDFEVIFVSSDYDSSSQFAYMNEYDMEFYTLTLRSDSANELSQKFEVSGLPTLIVVSNEGEMITRNGRTDITYYPDQALDKWKEMNGGN